MRTITSIALLVVGLPVLACAPPSIPAEASADGVERANADFAAYSDELVAWLNCEGLEVPGPEVEAQYDATWEKVTMLTLGHMAERHAEREVELARLKAEIEREAQFESFNLGEFLHNNAERISRFALDATAEALQDKTREAISEGIAPTSRPADMCEDLGPQWYATTGLCGCTDG